MVTVAVLTELALGMALDNAVAHAASVAQVVPFTLVAIDKFAAVSRVEELNTWVCVALYGLVAPRCEAK